MAIKSTTSRTVREWLRVERQGVSIGADVENGEVRRVQIDGLKNDTTIYLDRQDLHKLETISALSAEMITNIGDAKRRTGEVYKLLCAAVGEQADA